MSFQCSKEDHVMHISKSIFVTNFHDNYEARDLWKICEGYGKVVDVFIPNRKSKAGKRFAFGMDKLKCMFLLVHMRRLLKHVIGRVKEINYTPNLRSLLMDGGFPDVKLMYIGGMWVMLEFDKVDTKMKLLQHTGVNSWFQVLQDAVHDFVSDERIFWVDIEGIPLNVWSRETFLRIGKKWGETMDIEDNFDSSSGRKHLCIRTKHADLILEKFTIIFRGKVFMVRAKELFTWNPTFFDHKETEYSFDDESVHDTIKKPVHSQHSEEDSDDVVMWKEFSRLFLVIIPLLLIIVVEGWKSRRVSETIFGDNSSPPNNCSGGMEEQKFEDPFSIYDLLKKHQLGGTHESSPSLSHLPGFTPEEVQEESNRESASQNVGNNRGSVLGVLEDMIRVGQAMGYTMDGCIKDLEHIIGRWNGEAIIMGEFNEVWSEDERRGSVFNPFSARTFDHFIFSLGLVDVKLEGYAFTWSHPSAFKISKLDRFLVSEGILSLFPSITAICLDCHLSDHRPILLCEVHTDFGPILFWFYYSWFSLDGFDDMVEHAWNLFLHSDANGMIRFKKKSSIKNELGVINKDLDHGVVSDTNLHIRLELKRQLHDINQLEARGSLQKFKVKWAIEGDENSRFFLDIINKKHSQLSICRVFVDVVDLERSVSRDETRMPVWNYGENKSPGPDGYTFEFFRKYWSFVGPDFCVTVEYFFENGSFPKGCNSSFIALIPKVTDAKFVTDFRPISLIGCIYKVVMKILANRLALVISDLVSDTQSAFFANRQILDGPFILNEVLNWCKRKKKQAMFFKVDFAKAYDSVHWDYLLDVLQAFRLTLLKSVLGASPLYNMSIYKVPRGVLKSMEAIQSKFFNGADYSDKKITFHRLFALEMEKDVSVAVKMGASVVDSFRRAVRDGTERHQMLCLNSMLELVSLSSAQDRWICDLSGDGEFRVKVVRNILDDLFLPAQLNSTRWMKYIPIKINVFAWRARRDCLPTRSNLIRWGVPLVYANCPLCQTSEEDIQHVLFRCDLAQIVLRKICRWWDLDMKLTGNVSFTKVKRGEWWWWSLLWWWQHVKGDGIGCYGGEEGEGEGCVWKWF
nr:RNA-directed DNA polymerase, eukaryota [Tanacetum cinerariifolium]